MNKILSSKSSQFKIQEMSFMILGLAVFFMLILLFYLSISSGGLKKSAEAGSREGAILLIARLSGTPEFSCAESYSGGGSLCVDADKLMALINNPVFTTFWDIDSLKVEKVYPYPGNSSIACSLGNYPRCNTFIIKTSAVAQESGISDSSFVSICRKEYQNGYHYNKCELGKITATTRKTT